MDVSHRGVTNLLCNYPGNMNIRSETLVAQLLSISFDMGMSHPKKSFLNTHVCEAQWEILGTLMNGGTLLIRTSDWKYVLKRVSICASIYQMIAQVKLGAHHYLNTIHPWNIRKV